MDFWPSFDIKKDLLFHVLNNRGYQVEISDSPDYIVYSTFGKKHLEYDCIRIFFAGEEQSPDFNICDYAMGFDHICFGDRYFRLPLMYQPLYADSYQLMIKRGEHLIKTQDRKFCSFVYSNPQADIIREEFFNRLSMYKKVDSGGRYRNNIGDPVKDKTTFESGYKFSIAFENVSHPGYCTEKIMQAFAAGGVPIYWGDPLIEGVFNKEAFVNVMNFDSIDEAIKYVLYLDTNEEVYKKMVNEKPLIKGNEKEEIILKFEKFVDSIFVQDLNDAKRTTRTFWNLNYLTLARNQEKIYQMSTPLRSLRYNFLKIIGKKK